MIWSYLWYRDDTPNLTFSRLQQVEHEAFVTLLAERAGVPVQPVVAAGLVDQDAILVLGSDGRWLSAIADDEITDELLCDLWRAIARLHEGGIAHSAIDDEHTAVLPDGAGVLGDLAGSTAAASTAQIQKDAAQLLVASSLRVGSDRAVQAAMTEIGPDGVAALLPYVQAAGLTRATRKALDGAGTLKDLRAAAAGAAGTELPKLEPLRRVTWSSVLLLALLAFAAWAVISAFSNIGLATLSEELSSADQALIWAALIFSQFAWIAEAFSTLGACPVPLRLGPTTLLQFAIRFIALAVPSSAARVAVNVRFFQRAGSPRPVRSRSASWTAWRVSSCRSCSSP